MSIDADELMELVKRKNKLKKAEPGHEGEGKKKTVSKAKAKKEAKLVTVNEEIIPTVMLKQGLSISGEVSPPAGYKKAFILSGKLSFIGGRKHDDALGNIALALKNNKWHYLGRNGIPNVISSQEIDKWLDNIKGSV
jgi:hypothetical protein